MDHSIDITVILTNSEIDLLLETNWKSELAEDVKYYPLIKKGIVGVDYFLDNHIGYSLTDIGSILLEKIKTQK